ncbi:hypothetical protein MTR_0123s0050 [Medicago truncatula]|uniref:Uncharacterized protein n=1 Tax=Medicago truncatula TaxID=3880 RepID=A0A072THG2_MEDTR|nr:hypothetical protein MTR_0123s0050 [Medicago truncatula]
MEGYPFMWFKSLGTTRVVNERLDRAFATSTWFTLFPNVVLENLIAPASNHVIQFNGHTFTNVIFVMKMTGNWNLALRTS